MSSTAGHSSLVGRLFDETPVLLTFQRQRSLAYVYSKRLTLIVICIVFGLFYGIASALLLPYGAVPLGLSLLVLSLFVIWALPTVHAEVNPKWITRLFIAFFAAISLWPDYLSITLPGLPWISIRRAVAIPLTFLLLISLSQYQPLRQRLKDVFAVSPILSKALLVFFIAETASLALASPILVALGRYVNSLFGWWAVLIAAILAFTLSNKEKTWVKLFIIFTLLLCALNFLEVYNKQILWGPYLENLPSFISVDAASIDGLLRQSPYLRYRSKGVFTTSLSFAEYMALGAPFVAYLAARQKSVFRLFIYLMLNAVVALSIYLNGSRLGLIGLAVGFVVFIYLWVCIERDRNPRNVLVAAAFWLVPLASVGAVIAIKSFGRLNALFFGTGMQIYSTQARWDQLALLPAALIKRPIFGHGPGMGGQAIGYYDPNGLLTIDSYFITAFADFGLVGGVAYFTALISAVVISIRHVMSKHVQDRELAAAISASLAVYLTVRIVLSQDSNQSIMFMLFALVLAQAWKLRTGQAPTDRKSQTSAEAG